MTDILAFNRIHVLLLPFNSVYGVGVGDMVEVEEVGGITEDEGVGVVGTTTEEEGDTKGEGVAVGSAAAAVTSTASCAEEERS